MECNGQFRKHYMGWRHSDLAIHQRGGGGAQFSPNTNYQKTKIPVAQIRPYNIYRGFIKILCEGGGIQIFPILGGKICQNILSILIGGHPYFAAEN